MGLGCGVQPAPSKCRIFPCNPTANALPADALQTAAKSAPSPTGSYSQRSTVCSCGAAASTSTWNANVLTVFGTLHCHVFAPETCSVWMIWL